METFPHLLGSVWRSINQLRCFVYLPFSHSHEVSTFLLPNKQFFNWSVRNFSLTLKNVKFPCSTKPNKQKVCAPYVCHHDGWPWERYLTVSWPYDFHLVLEGGTWDSGCGIILTRTKWTLKTTVMRCREANQEWHWARMTFPTSGQGHGWTAKSREPKSVAGDKNFQFPSTKLQRLTSSKGTQYLIVVKEMGGK